jgi:dTDP-4-amino-4,6-dideoxygalactose transaminase
MESLAILGGTPFRSTPFLSRPMIDEAEKLAIMDCLDNKMFSRYVGSPVGNFRQYLKMKSSEAKVLNDFWSLLGGPYVRKFEAEFADLHRADFAISSNSATSSIISAMIACGIKDGDEVITTPFSFTATATAIKLGGGKPVFADINKETFCIDVNSVAKRLTKKTKVVVPVHLLGNDADIINLKDFCQQKGLMLIEDSAQALFTSIKGKFLGTFGDVGIFSFQESKNMMTGEGGIALTNNVDLAYKLRLIRNHGEAMVFEGEDSQDIIDCARGYNFRLPDPLAAIGLCQTRKVKLIQQIRNQNYYYLKTKLAEFEFLKFQKVSNYIDSFSPYCVGVTFEHSNIHRNTFAQALRSEGIPVTTGFPRLLNENPFTKEDLQFTQNAKDLNTNKYLGFFQVGFPNTQSDMDDIIGAIKKISNNFDKLSEINHQYLTKREYTLGR